MVIFPAATNGLSATTDLVAEVEVSPASALSRAEWQADASNALAMSTLKAAADFIWRDSLLAPGCKKSGFGTVSDIRRDGAIRPLTHDQKANALVEVHTDERPLSGRRLPLETDHIADMVQPFLGVRIESGPHRRAPPSTRMPGRLSPGRHEFRGAISTGCQTPARAPICPQKRLF
jgi:hypothetical protein